MATETEGPHISSILRRGNSGIPMESEFMEIVKNAATQGGSLVQNYFSYHSRFVQFFQKLTEGGDKEWILDTEKESGQTFYFANQYNGEVDPTFYFILTYTLLDTPSTDQTSSLQRDSISEDGTSSDPPADRPMGSYNVSLNYGDTIFQGMTMDMILTGGSLATLSALMAANLQCILQGLRRSIQAQVDNIGVVAEQSAEEIEELAETQALELSVDFSVSVALGAMTGICIVATAVVIALEFLEKTTVHQLDIHNHTQSDITWGNVYFDHGNLINNPVQGQGADLKDDYVIPKVQNTAPPIGDPIYQATYGSFIAQEKNAMWGVGWAINLTLQIDKKTVSADIAFSCPYSGDNKLGATFNGAGPKAEYDSLGSSNKVLNGNVEDKENNIKILFSIDALAGKQPQILNDPESPLVWCYRSVVIVEYISPPLNGA